MLPMLIIKKNVNIIKQHGEGDMLAKRPMTFHNSLKIAVRETLLKIFSTSTWITTQSVCKSMKALMPKRMVS